MNVLERGWREKPWVFLRLVPPGSPRTGDLPEEIPGGFVHVAWEVVHAPGFAMWATPAMQRRLEKVLTSRSEFDKPPWPSPTKRWAERGVLPAQPRESTPLGTDRFGTGLVLLTPDYKLLGSSSFGAFFSAAVPAARRRQPAPVRLAHMVALIATGFEEPHRTWGPAGEAFERVLPPRSDLRDEYTLRDMVFRETVLRVAMLKALPRVLDSLPEAGGADAVREGCRVLAEWLREELFPDAAPTDQRYTDGARAVFTPELLAFPRVKRLLFERTGASDPPLRLFRAIVRARLTPDRMCALLMRLWEIEPLDKRERDDLKVHLSRALARCRTALRERADPGGDL